MDIAYASDDGYCQHLAVSIASVIDNNLDTPIRFHIISDGIGDEHIRDIEDMVREARMDVSFYKVDDLESLLRARVSGMETGRLRSTTMARLLLGSLLPAEVEKVLYLDADTVILHGLGGLYDFELGDDIIAMAPEPVVNPEVRWNIGLDDDEPYCNAGVILFDLAEWRRRELESRCFAYYAEVDGKLPYSDQDILNHVLKGKIGVLPQRFNFFSNYHYFRFSYLLALSGWYGRYEDARSFSEARSDPTILHFAGAESPWCRGSRNHYRSLYRSYLSRTSFAGSEMAPGRELYLQAYHLMNVLTYILPRVRTWISHAYFNRTMRDRYGLGR